MKTLVSVVCMVLILIFSAVICVQDAAASSSVTCEKDNLSRTVEVTYTNQQGEPPCEVHYKKTVEQPGHDQILWDSQHTKDYCETKQQEFVQKLEGMGWSCR